MIKLNLFDSTIMSLVNLAQLCMASRNKGTQSSHHIGLQHKTICRKINKYSAENLWV